MSIYLIGSPEEGDFYVIAPNITSAIEKWQADQETKEEPEFVQKVSGDSDTIQ